MKKVFKYTTLGILLFGGLFTVDTVNASEIDSNNVMEEITKARPEMAFETSDHTLRTLTVENSQLVAEFEAESQENTDYIRDIINNLNVRTDITDTDFNNYVMEALNAQKDLQNNASQKLDIAMEQYNESLQLQQNSRSLYLPDPVAAARTAYDVGIAMVLNRGGNMTAKYMQHAKVAGPWSANPSTYVSSNDAWARQIMTPIIEQTYADFKRNGLGKPIYTQSGSFAFTAGDPYWALHRVSYNINYVQRSTGGYGVTVTVTDIYDFDWGPYNNISVGFGNNYCAAMQRLGLIKPFNIRIVYSYG